MFALAMALERRSRRRNTTPRCSLPLMLSAFDAPVAGADAPSRLKSSMVVACF
jgi:hypothetical protein